MPHQTADIPVVAAGVRRENVGTCFEAVLKRCGLPRTSPTAAPLETTGIGAEDWEVPRSGRGKRAA